MKTVTGNIVRKCYSRLGQIVSSYAEACAHVGFSIVQESVSRTSNAKEIPNTRGLFRSDNGDCLGIHTEAFSLVQPSESLKLLERARELVKGVWASVQVNKGGRMIAGFIEVEDKIIVPKRGDTIALSLSYFDHFDGKGKARFGLSACNLTCNNGMTSLKDILSFNTKHVGDIKGRMLTIEAKLQFNWVLAVNEMRDRVTKLDATPMSQSEVEGFARALFPTADESDLPTRTLNMREAIATGFVRGTGNQGRTRWDAFNAVTEFVDWQATYRETDFSREENRFESVMTGNGASLRERALELLTA